MSESKHSHEHGFDEHSAAHGTPSGKDAYAGHSHGSIFGARSELVFSLICGALLLVDCPTPELVPDAYRR